MENKRKRTFRKERAKFKIPLDDVWNLVFLSSGRRFYYNSKENRSLWDPPETLTELVQTIDKDQMILLIARARGLKLGGEDDDNDQRNATEGENSGFAVDIGSEEDELEEGPAETKDQEELEVDNVENDSSSDEDVFNPDDLMNSDDGDSEHEVSGEEARASFEAMLDEFSVNPYGVWSTELNKVIEDERYEIYDSNAKRAEAFDLWAKTKISSEQVSQAAGGSIEESPGNPKSSDPVAQFLLFVKKNYMPKKFYIDFKRKNRKCPEFADSDLSDKDKETLYREFSVIMKKSPEERLKIMNTKLESVSEENLYMEPVYYTLSEKDLSLIQTRTHSDSKNKKLEQAAELQRQADVERRKLSKDLYHSRKRMEAKNQEIMDATYGGNALSHLKEELDRGAQHR